MPFTGHRQRQPYLTPPEKLGFPGDLPRIQVHAPGPPLALEIRMLGLSILTSKSMEKNGQGPPSDRLSGKKLDVSRVSVECKKRPGARFAPEKGKNS
jgi:hypothetical protein